MNINKVIMTSFLLSGCVVSTGCATSMMNSDQFRMSGTPEGIRAFSDTLSGVGIIAKTTPAELPNNPHSLLREAQEIEKTNRIRLRFMSKLKSPAKATTKGGK